MHINGRHISSYYGEITEIESFVYNYDLAVLEALLKFIRESRRNLENICAELAIYNPPKSEDNLGYTYPEGVDPFEYWKEKSSYKFSEFDYYEALISEIFQAKKLNYMNKYQNIHKEKEKGKPEPEPEFNFKELFVSDVLYDQFLQGLIFDKFLEKSTLLKMPKAQSSMFGGILKLLYPMGFIKRKLKNSELKQTAKLFGFEAKEDTLRKGEYIEKRFKEIFLK